MPWDKGSGGRFKTHFYKDWEKKAAIWIPQFHLPEFAKGAKEAWGVGPIYCYFRKNRGRQWKADMPNIYDPFFDFISDTIHIDDDIRHLCYIGETLLMDSEEKYDYIESTLYIWPCKDMYEVWKGKR